MSEPANPPSRLPEWASKYGPWVLAILLVIASRWGISPAPLPALPMSQPVPLVVVIGGTTQPSITPVSQAK